MIQRWRVGARQAIRIACLLAMVAIFVTIRSTIGSVVNN